MKLVIRNRIHHVFYYERKFKRLGFRSVIGVDEAGRGPLAGPVVAAAVLLKTSRFKNRVDDSKKLSPHQREEAFPEIVRNSIFGIGIISEKVIDEFNILEATRLAMENAVLKLIDKIKDSRKGRIQILVDGNVKLAIGMPYTNIIRGDSRSKSIAAASILAKVTRDRIMSVYDRVYPQYGFLQHKGYPTQAHRVLLAQFGPCLIHRKSFCGV